MEWGVNEWVAVISAILAIVSLAFNYMVVRKQTELQTATLRVEMDSEVIAWTLDKTWALRILAALESVDWSATQKDGNGQ